MMIRLFAAAAMLSLCIQARSAEPAIGLLLPTQQEERWVRDLHVIREEARRQGARLETAIARSSQEQQNRQALELLEKNIDVLIIAPHDGEDAAPAVKAAKDAGIPVICYDRLVYGASADMYVSFDNTRVGELQGEWLAARVPRGRYIVLEGPASDGNSAMLAEGVMKVLRPLAERGDIEIAARRAVGDWQPANALKIVESVLAGQGTVDAVVAPNDATAGGALLALEAAGLGGRTALTGQDADTEAARRIAAGTQSMTVFKDTRLLGAEAVRLALLLAAGETAEAAAGTGGSEGKRVLTMNNGLGDVQTVLLEPAAVDASSLHLLTDSGYMKKEDIFPAR